jgi:purine-binding chemotaxis protein CheW
MATAINETTSTTPTTPGQALVGKYLTFALGEEEYGLPVLRVREIIKMMDITVVPQVPPYVKGVINLRGKVIPVVDLRLKFNFPSIDYTERTSIIVVHVTLASGSMMMGIVVDAVSEVINIAADEIEATPEFGDDMKTDYLQGLAKIKGKVKLLLDLDQVFGGERTFARGIGQPA